MNKVAAALGFLLILHLGTAQTYVGSWAITETVDPFTDERSTTVLIGDNGQIPAESEAQLAMICTNGTLEQILVQFNSSVDTEVKKTFDYRLDAGEVQQGEAWVNGRGVAVSPKVEVESFKALLTTLLSGGSRLAVRVKDSLDEYRTAIFSVERIDEALAEADCAPPSDEELSAADPFGDADAEEGEEDGD